MAIPSPLLLHSFLLRTFALVLASLVTSVTTAGLARAQAGDLYADFAALSRAEHEGTDFRVISVDRGSPVTVLAIHGGGIEPGSDEIAREIAGNEFNLYLFLAVSRKAGFRRLHITATHFDDRRAVALTTQAKVAISVHGMAETNTSHICVGGGNVAYRTATIERLKRAFPTIHSNFCAESLPGTSPDNIVNRAQNAGLQLEISSDIRNRAMKDDEFRKALARAVRVMGT